MITANKTLQSPREVVDRHQHVSQYYQMLKRFVSQKPMPPIKEEPRFPEIADDPDNSHLPIREESKTPTIIENPHPKPMADHGGKDILSSDVEIKGSIKFQKELLIDGKVEGDIISDGVLTVGENAEIQGEIKTKSITVYGRVHGNITVAERCELKSKCILQGDLKAARLTIEEGATFIGKSEVTSGTLPSKAAPSRPEVVRSSEPIKAAFGARA
jgi:cytoskeletal protein CcmA (bactofilin family)